jgi:hypothetical protein
VEEGGRRPEGDVGGHDLPGASGSGLVHAGTGSNGRDSPGSRARSEAFSQPVVIRSLPNPYDPSNGT